jgi:cytochrome c oxidase subunit 2
MDTVNQFNQPLSDITREVDLAFNMMGWISLVLLLGITLAMVWFVIRYSRGRARTTTQIQGNLWLEVTWVVLPVILVTWMFWVGYKGFLLIREVPEGAMVVQVTGQQWSWSFYYPEEGISTTELTVPVNTPVKAEITSPPGDVIHSFYIPDFRVKEDAVPGKETYLWFESERVGDFNIFCAEYCGKNHSQMISMLHVVSEEDYRKWIKAQEQKKYKPLEFAGLVDPKFPAFGPDDLNINAGALYLNYCASCHGAQGDGSGLPGVARNFNDRPKWKKSTRVTDIYRTLMEGIPGTQMRSFPNFTPWEKVGLAHTVRGFIRDGAEPITEEDYAALVEQYGLDRMQGPQETIPVERAMELLTEEAASAPPPPPGPGDPPPSARQK